LHRSIDRPFLTSKDVDTWLAGPGQCRLDDFRAELRAPWFFADARIRRRIFADVGKRWNGDARFRLDVEQSLRAVPECLLEVARRLAANQLLALASEDSVRRIVAVPRAAVAAALTGRVHRELAPLHTLEPYPGLLETLLRRLAAATENASFRELRRASTAIPSAPRALILGGEGRLRWGEGPTPRGTWWVLETRMSSNDFTRDEAREAIARTLRPALRKLKKDLSRRQRESRISIGDRAVDIAVEPAARATPLGPRRRRKPQSGVVVVTSAELDG
jgi:hypothetical protein